MDGRNWRAVAMPSRSCISVVSNDNEPDFSAIKDLCHFKKDVSTFYRDKRFLHLAKDKIFT